MFISAKEMSKCLLSVKSADILCHRSPDGDTVGCAVALYYGLKQKGIPTRIVCADEIPEYLSFMLPKEFDLKSTGESVIAVDIAAKGLLAGIESSYPRVDFNIDHHPSNEDFATKSTLVDTAAAAAEVVADLLE